MLSVELPMLQLCYAMLRGAYKEEFQERGERGNTGGDTEDL